MSDKMEEHSCDDRKRGPVAAIHAVHGWRAIHVIPEGDELEALAENRRRPLRIAITGIAGWGLRAPTGRGMYAPCIDRVMSLETPFSGGPRFDPIDPDGDWIPHENLWSYVGPDEPDDEAIRARVLREIEADTAKDEERARKEKRRP